jgi:hypothetical protein
MSQFKRLRALPVCTLASACLIAMNITAVPARAASGFGVTMSAQGEAGNACIPLPNSPYGGFSYSGSASRHLNESFYTEGGMSNGSNCYGDFADAAASGTARMGILTADASADMIMPVVNAVAGLTDGWTDTITITNGGMFQATVTLGATASANPSGCPSSPSSDIVAYANVGDNYGEISGVSWNWTDCSKPDPQVYNAAIINRRTVQFNFSATTGQVISMLGSLQADASVGTYRSNETDTTKTRLTLTLVGLDGATFQSASGSTY